VDLNGAASAVRADDRGQADIDTLRALYEVVTRVHSSPDLEATLDAIGKGVVDATCFGVAVVNLVLPNGDFQVVSVTGSEEASATLLGCVEPAEMWTEVLENSQRIGALRYVDHNDPALGEEMAEWVPDIAVSDDPDMWHPMDALFAPLLGSDGSCVGVLSVDLPKDGRRPGPEQYETLELFAAHAALAIQNAHNYVTQQQVVMLQARGRLAEDLHDLVVQRLFAAGLEVSLALGLSQSSEQGAYLNSVLATLDEAVEELRSSIYTLNQDVTAEEIETALGRVASLASRTLRFEPALSWAGDISAIRPETAADLLAVVNEALSNVAKHAQATTVTVDVTIADDELAVTVADNGRGMPNDELRRRSGLGNIENRARRHGGAVTWVPNSPSGTIMRWVVPLPAASGR